MIRSLVFFLTLSSLFSQTLRNYQILGELEDTSELIESDQLPYSTINMATRRYDYRLPVNYSETETYGLFAYCNATQSGYTIASDAYMLPLLDKYRLLFVAGDLLSNYAPDTRRRTATALGARRMTELYNIDPNHIYAGGNSGGSRMSNSLVLLNDDFFTGFIGRVGATTPGEIPDDFITTTDAADLTYENLPTVAEFQTSARLAYQTYYHPTDPSIEGDFREDEVSSIYHLGSISSGNQALLVQAPGDHGTQDQQSFEESLKYMRNPLHTIVSDTCDGTAAYELREYAGTPTWTTLPNIGENASGAVAGSIEVPALVLADGDAVRSAHALAWNNDYGCQLQASIGSSREGQYNHAVEIGLTPADPSIDCALYCSISYLSDTEKVCQLYLRGKSGVDQELCSFQFDHDDEPTLRERTDRAYFSGSSDYEAWGYLLRGLDLSWVMNDDRFQLIVRQNIDRDSFQTSYPGLSLLKDHWTIQGRWAEMNLLNEINSLKDVEHWQLYVRNSSLTGDACDTAWVQSIQLHNVLRPVSVPETGLPRSHFSQGEDGLLHLSASDYLHQEVQGIHWWVSDSLGSVSTEFNYGTRYSADETLSTWSSYLQYAVEFAEAGEYNVWVKASGATTNDQSCYIGTAPDADHTVSLSGFSTVASWRSARLTIPTTGAQFLYLMVQDDGIEIEEIILSPADDFDPLLTTSTPDLVSGYPDNFAPSGSNLTLYAGDSLEVHLPAIDLEGADLTVSYTQPDRGTLSGSFPTLTYTADESLEGYTTSFQYTLYDGVNDSPTYTVTLNALGDLIGEWTLNTINSDSSIPGRRGHGNDALLTGAYPITGVVGSGLGVGIYSSGGITFPARLFETVSEELTISCWAEGAASLPDRTTFIRSLNSSYQSVINVHLPWSDGSVYFDAGNSGATVDRISKAATSQEYQNQWNHWVFTKNATTGEMHIYLNGTLWASGTNKFYPMTEMTDLIIGVDYQGAFDEIKIYQRALTATEVLDIYESYTEPFSLWRRSHDLDPAGSQNRNDSDGDGTPNILEYAFNTDPSDQSSHPSLQLDRVSDTGHLSLTFPRRMGGALVDNEWVVDGIKYRVEYTSNLGGTTWSADASDLEWLTPTTSGDDTTEQVGVRLRAPASGGPTSAFLRLVVEEL